MLAVLLWDNPLLNYCVDFKALLAFPLWMVMGDLVCSFRFCIYTTVLWMRGARLLVVMTGGYVLMS